MVDIKTSAERPPERKEREAEDEPTCAERISYSLRPTARWDGDGNKIFLFLSRKNNYCKQNPRRDEKKTGFLRIPH